MTEGRQHRSLKNLRLTRKYRFQFLGVWMIVLTVLILMLNLSIYTNYGQLWAAGPHPGGDFITNLAYVDLTRIANAKVGIFVASILAGIIGYVLLARRKQEPSLIVKNME